MLALEKVSHGNLSYRRDKQLVAEYLLLYEQNQSAELLEILVRAHWELVEYLAGKLHDPQLRAICPGRGHWLNESHSAV